MRGVKIAIAIATAFTVVIFTGCSSKPAISGSVGTVYEQLKDIAVDETVSVEVTGYILEEEPANRLAGSSEHHSTLNIYDSTEESNPYIIAVFAETPDELNNIVAESGSVGPIRRVTVTGEISGNNIGSLYSSMYNCEITVE